MNINQLISKSVNIPDRIAMYNFDTFEDAEEFAKESNGEIRKIHWKDGQRVANDMGWAHEPISIHCEDYGDDYQFWKYPDMEFSYLKDSLQDTESFEDIESLIEIYKKNEEEYSVKGDDEEILTCRGAYYDTIQTSTMFCSIDTNNYAIAVITKAE